MVEEEFQDDDDNGQQSSCCDPKDTIYLVLSGEFVALQTLMIENKA